MYDFSYHRPGTLDEAAALLASHEDSRLLAGGMSLVPTLKMRLARVSAVVDLRRIDPLKGIRREADSIVIGAMTTHATVAASGEIAKTIPALSVLAGGIGDPLVRNCGTLGGSIANADPAADYPAAVVGLDAEVWTNHRKIPGGQFFRGLFETALQPGEIVVAVSFPIPKAAAYAKLRQPASRFALVGILAARTSTGVRVAVTGAGPAVFRWNDAERALERRFDAGVFDAIDVNADGLNSDMHASAEYRAHCMRIMAQRAVRAAMRLRCDER